MAHHTVVPLAADSVAGLARAASALRSRLSDPAVPLHELVEASPQGAFRRCIVVADPASLGPALEAFDPDGTEPIGPARVAFLFTGQGSQYPGMTHELRQTAAFAAVFAEVAAALEPHLPAPLATVLDDPGGPLASTAWTQPSLFAVEVSVSRLLARWGVHPDVVIGHSVGELAAACVAGVLSLEDAACLVAARGRLMGALPQGGAMMAFKGDPAVILEAVRSARGVDVAGLNAPTQVVVSGDEGPVARVGESLAAQGIRGTPLAVSHAFHSHRMDPMLTAFRDQATSVALVPPATALIGNLTGTVYGPGDAAPEGPTDPAYWVRHVREAVRFSDGVAALESLGVTLGVEVGPHPVLAALCRSCGLRVPTLAMARRKRSDRMMVARALAGLWEAGVNVDWGVVWPDLMDPPGSSAAG